MSYRLVAHHRSMAFDDGRNLAYRRAIDELVTPSSAVLDLGAGIGILGLAAARQGARKVYLLDPEPVVHLGRDLAGANGLADRVEVIRGRIEDTRLPEPVDIILSVFTGNFLLDEDLLPLLFLARDRFLRPGGHLIPDRARMQIVPVEATAFYAEHIEAWGRRDDGMDYSAGRVHAANTAYFESARRLDAEPLGPPCDLAELDLLHAAKAECRAEAEIRFERAGTCHGLLGWFDMRLGSEWLSTSPLAPATHWSQAFLPLDPPLPVTPGQVATVAVRRPQHGDWYWGLRSGQELRRHSTFLATLVPRRDIERLAGFARPRPSPLGQAARAALEAMDGTTPIDEIAAGIYRDHAAAFSSPEDAADLVRRLVRRYA